ncbi:MAG: hypothetical protein H6874_01560 [Hyphomicrobiaceae bacterium]|nr:hypothetical protein [Hyphomicrobiaceae bacterium]
MAFGKPELDLASLRVLSGWAADCAERVLFIFLKAAADDPRPKAAIVAARKFADGASRDNDLRKRALDAFRAANAAGQSAAAAAAHSASAAAGAAFLHPLANPHQVKHILGAAAYAALALEREGAETASDAVVQMVADAPPEIVALLVQYPACAPAKGRLGEILVELDTRLRHPAKHRK